MSTTPDSMLDALAELLIYASTELAKQRPQKSTKPASKNSPRTVWLTTAEAAELMQISKGTLDNWRSAQRRGRPQATHFGKKVRYDQAEILRWIDAQKEKVRI